MAQDGASPASLRLRDEVDPRRDHVRGVRSDDSVTVVGYMDFLCPYCRRLRPVFARIRDVLGDRLVYVFRYFPIERAHPGAELAARAAEAAALQGQFFEMHDWLFDHALPIGRSELLAAARELGLDVERFVHDLESDRVGSRVEQDVSGGRTNGVTGTPTLLSMVCDTTAPQAHRRDDAVRARRGIARARVAGRGP